MRRRPVSTQGNAVRRPRVLRRYAAVAVCIALPLVAIWALTLGDIPIPVPDAAAAALGRGAPGDVLVVQQWRAPRVLAALVVGAALALSGALLQALLRNPLAAPDVLGVTDAAALCLVLATVAGLPAVALPPAAFAGALLAAGALVLLTHRRGLAEETTVLVGIGLHAVFAAATLFLVVRFPVEVAQQTVRWTVGTLYASAWPQAGIGLAVLAVLTPVALLLTRRLAVLQLGVDLATGLGLSVRRTRLAVTAVAVALAAVAVAIGGPVSFVALAVPQAARRLAGPLGVHTLLLSAGLGALVVLAADIAAQHAFAVVLPVGAITATVGAPIFLWLLLRSPRRRGAK